MVIYVDILLVLNWWIDYFLLLGVRRSQGGGAKAWRLALGALVGAAACFALFLPAMPLWLSLTVKLTAALCMVLVAFRWQGWRRLLRRVFLLFAFSAGLAGVCSALYFFVAPRGFYVCNGVVYYAFPPLLLVGLTVVCYGLLWLGERWLQRRAPAGHLFRVRLHYGDAHVEFPCLYDSGNQLVEPFSGRPVLVVERDVAEGLLEVPPSVEELPPHSGAGWRLVPFDTVQGGGLLPAFVPHGAAVKIRSEWRPLSACYVAVCDRLGGGEYRGLMGSAMGEDLL